MSRFGNGSAIAAGRVRTAPPSDGGAIAQRRITAMPAMPDRFWGKVDKTDGCWLWKAAIGDDGYGRFNLSGGGQIMAHRMAYKLVKGEIPEGLVIDHVCRNRGCVNPWHLEAVSQLENLLRCPGWPGHRTHCARGHKFTESNTWLWTDKRGRVARYCKACWAVRHEIARKKKRRPADESI